MANAVQAKLRFGPATYYVSSAATAGNSVTGGSLVAFDGTTGTVRLATAGDVVTGVALYDGQPADSSSGTDTVGNTVFNYAITQPEIAVAWTGVFKLTATAAAIAQGALVYAAAGGKISTTVPGSGDTRPVGQVVNPGGIASSGSGYVRLF